MPAKPTLSHTSSWARCPNWARQPTLFATWTLTLHASLLCVPRGPLHASPPCLLCGPQHAFPPCPPWSQPAPRPRPAVPPGSCCSSQTLPARPHPGSQPPACAHDRAQQTLAPPRAVSLCRRIHLHPISRPTCVCPHPCVVHVCNRNGICASCTSSGSWPCLHVCPCVPVCACMRVCFCMCVCACMCVFAHLLKQRRHPRRVRLQRCGVGLVLLHSV